MGDLVSRITRMLAPEIPYENRRKLKDPRFVNRLAKIIDFDRLATSLRQSGAFTEAMINDIRQHAELEERNRRLLQQVSKGESHAYQCFLAVLQNNGMLEALSLLEGGTPLHQGLPANARCIQVWAPGPGSEAVFSNPPQSNDDVRTGEASEVEVEVIPATELKRGPLIYPMERKPRGRCLIINNTFTYSPSLCRKDSKKDACRMEKLFTKFGFECLVYPDLSADIMMEKLCEVAEEELQKVADCLMVVLMSRGDTGIIYGNDNKPLYLNEIFKVFNNKNCPSLQGKPKVFFIEACPGEEVDAETFKYAPRDMVDSRKDDLDAQDGPEMVPTWSDMCFCYASVDNLVSYRIEETGSLFLSAVCSVFSRHACDTHLLDLMLHVTAEVIERASQQGYCQIPCSELEGWRGQLYFNPGLPVDPIPQPTPCMEQQTMQISGVL